MEKDNLKLYVYLMNRYYEQAKIGMTLVFNEDEKHLMTYMKKIAMKDKEANKFLNSLTNMTPDERYLAVENLFNKKEGKKDIITINEVKDYKDEIASMSKQDQNKLNYIINNYNKLKVKGINLNDLTQNWNNYYNLPSELILRAFSINTFQNSTNLCSTQSILIDNLFSSSLGRFIAVPSSFIKRLKPDVGTE